jgi:hypothetical protein
MPAASVLQAARKQLARVHVCSRRAALCSVAPHGHEEAVALFV